MKKYNYFFVLVILCSYQAFSQYNNVKSDYIINNELPDDFTEISITAFDQSTEKGYLFLTFFGDWGIYPDVVHYQVITDNYATPIYFKKFDFIGSDFKVQQGNLITYFNPFTYDHSVCNSSFELLYTIGVKNYPTDFHDFHILDNGNYLLLGIDNRIVDMDTVVQGGYPGVTVAGALVQIQDPSGNILFEWSSFDHYLITDAMDYIVNIYDSSYIDWVHANALEIDSDSTLLICARNLDEITKINLNTGDIIWRLGGKNNEFTFINDTLHFSMAHDIRRLPDGLYQLFDNGVIHNPQFSSVVQYSLDESQKIATLVNRYRSTPDDIFGAIMGNGQYLDNGHVVTGWGSGYPSITEFKPDGSKALEFAFEAANYRAFRFDWEPTAIDFDQDSINFGYLKPNDSSERWLYVTNNLGEIMYINTFLSRTGQYYPASTFPLDIQSGETQLLMLKFQPDSEGIFNDVLTIGYDVDDQTMTRRIAKQIPVKGIASNDAGISEYADHDFFACPNPVTDHCVLIFRNKIPDMINIYDILGNHIKERAVNQHRVTIDFQDMKPGVYIISSVFKDQRVLNTKVIKR